MNIIEGGKYRPMNLRSLPMVLGRVREVSSLAALLLSRILATEKWSLWAGSTSSRFSSSFLQCSWISDRLLSRPEQIENQEDYFMQKEKKKKKRKKYGERKSQKIQEPLLFF